MKCYVCDKDDFHSFEKLHPERELLCCRECGAVMFKVEPEEEAKVLDYYRKEYRPQPNHMNLVTTTHKLNYVKNFLRDHMHGKEKLLCGDVGCATGYLVHEFARNGHRATGCELTLTFRRFSEHYYGIPIPEEFPEKHKYDLITIYHVLEHLIQPDVKLKKYVDLLKDDGRLMIATPEWYGILQEASEDSVGTFDKLWHKDHINVFSRQALQNLFAKCGLEIEKFDHLAYGQTYLLKKTATPAKIVPEKWEEQVAKTLKAREALNAYHAKQFKKAVEAWPLFPEALLAPIFSTYAKDLDKQTDEFAKLKAIPEIWELPKVRWAYGTWLYQQQSWAETLEHFSYVMQVKPNEDILLQIGLCHMFMNRGKEAIDCFYGSAEMNPQKWMEATDLMCKVASGMPSWDERAKEEFVKQMLEKTQFKPTLNLNVEEPEKKPAEPVVTLDK